MPSAIAAARVSGLEELSEWIALSAAKGADRFELWSKVRGTEQQRAHVAVQTEPFEIADELLTCVERDGRAGSWAGRVRGLRVPAARRRRRASGRSCRRRRAR